MKYDSILGTVGNTPVVRINHLAPKGINLFVKIEALTHSAPSKTASPSESSKTPKNAAPSNPARL